MSKLLLAEATLGDGTRLGCSIVVTPTFDNDSGHDVSDPTYFVNGVEVAYGALPTHLNYAAHRLFIRGPYTEVHAEH